MRDPSPLTGLAADQHGVVTMRQANLAGVPRKAVQHRLEAAWWRRLERGVYLTNNGEPSVKARLMAALLLVGREAALTHLAAAWLHELEPNEPEFVVICVPPTRRVRSRDGIRVQQRAGVASTIVDRLAVSSVADTVVDLAGSRSLDAAIALAARAVQRRMTTAPLIAASLGRRVQHRWLRELRLALSDIDDGAESILEVRFVRDVIRRHGLPEPRMQAEELAPGGKLRRDFDWEEWQLIAEVDGELGHAGEGLRRDRTRDRRAARSGRLTLRCGWVDVVHDSCQVALDIALTLHTRGWRGIPTPCSPMCPVADARFAASHPAT